MTQRTRTRPPNPGASPARCVLCLRAHVGRTLLHACRIALRPVTRSRLQTQASPSLGPARAADREAPSRAKAPAPVPAPAAELDDKDDEPEAKPPKAAAAPAPAAQSYRAPSPRIGSWRQQSPGRGGRTPRAEVQRRQARQVKDDSDSDLDDIAVRRARDAMPSTSPLSLAPALNGSKKKTYSRHASPSPVYRPSHCVRLFL